MENTALTQLASVGILWVAFHCAGMCGPIVGGVVGAGASSTSQATLGLLRYQLGRATGLGGSLEGARGRRASSERCDDWDPVGSWCRGKRGL